ncbi:MAG: poly(A) polymerase [Spirochaetia bacterium]|nr:poly(A) polymerase [Spirochaetia bacterium]
MRTRYKKDHRGVNIPIANVYDQEEHHIKVEEVDGDALYIIRKLHASGATAYIVGGAVRDLLLNKRPKDFDIATSFTPRQVQKLFYNARVIGKRFKLVHITFPDKIIEVSTFRSGVISPDVPSDIYGTVEQDAKRRDFTINSLYYNPVDGHVLDFNRAMHDMEKKRVRSILPLGESFIEDPVRMIRAIKYSVTTNFSLSFDVKRAIKRDGVNLSRISSSRITEEVIKILSSGYASSIFEQLQKHKILIYILPSISLSPSFQLILQSLKLLDRSVNDVHSGKSNVVNRSDMISALVAPIMNINQEEEEEDKEYFLRMFSHVKELIHPITPANYDVEQACASLLKEKGFVVSPTWYKARKPVHIPGRVVKNKKSKRYKGPRMKRAKVNKVLS